MASNYLDVLKRVRAQVNAVVEDRFLGAVESRAVVLQREVRELVQELFYDISDAMGGEGPPSELSGVQWKPLTAKWVASKYKKANKSTITKRVGEKQLKIKRGSPIGRQNSFYIGRTGSYREDIARQAFELPYGEPIVRVSATGAVREGFVLNRRGRAQFAKGAPNSQGGRFASNAAALTAGLEVIAFPKISTGADVIAPFGGKALWGEFGAPASNRPARPFLVPFVEFYTDVKVKQLIQEVLSR